MSEEMRIRVLIVDDEELARRGIRTRLARAGDVDIVGECASGREATRAIETLKPDLVFLDVQMPGVDGFGVVGAVGADRMPTTIFVTAYDQYALEAFEAAALDYLLKPIDDERFERAFERARCHLTERRESLLGRRLSAALAQAGLLGEPRAGASAPAADQASRARFLARRRGRLRLIGAEEIDWVEAAGDYVNLHVGSESHTLRESMGAMEAKLDPNRFVRIHRSTIVNVERIRELQPYSNREYVLVLENGTKLKLSRTYRDRLEQALGGSL